MDEQEQVIIPGVEISKPRKVYPKLESVEDIPESRSQLSYDWMVQYALANGTPEQCADLLDFIEKNQVIRESHLKRCRGVEFTVTDIKPMRNLFCDMFFPALKEYKSKPKSKESQLDMARRLLAEKAAQAGQETKEKAPTKRTTRAKK